MHHVVAQKSERQHPSPTRAGVSRRGVQGLHVETDHVTWFQFPADHPVLLRIAIDIGQLGQ
jgi:hypothetical protein